VAATVLPLALRDDGYDIADYTGIHPAYGTLADFRRFLREAHKRGLRVVTELVLNHTSDQHPWFQRARRAKPGSPHRDFYVWSEAPDKYRQARIIFKDFEQSNWAWDPVAKAYFWHRFYANQPDLNYDNPAVRRAMLRWWISGWARRGRPASGRRAVSFRAPGHQLRESARDPRVSQGTEGPHGRLFSGPDAARRGNQWPEDAVAYFGDGDECHMAFHFPIMPRIFMSLWAEDRYPIVDILEQTPSIPESCQWALFLRNHDELTLEMVSDEERDSMYRAYARDARARINLGIRRRLAPLMQNNRRKMELIYILLLSFPGTPILYYGDELGMGDNYHLGDRNGVRTPMQWSPDRNAGFSKANPQSLFLPVIIDPEYHYELVNVETLEHNASSFLWWMRRLLAAYKAAPALGRGGMRFVRGENPKVLALLRSDGENRLLAVINLSRHAQVTELDLADLAGFTPVDVFGQTRFPVIGREPYVLTMGAFGYFWFRLENGHGPQTGETEDACLLLAGAQARAVCDLDVLSEPGGHVLPPSLDRVVERLTRVPAGAVAQIDELPLEIPSGTASLILAENQDRQGDPANHFLVVTRLREHGPEDRDVNPEAVLARLACPDGAQALVNGLLDSGSLAALVAFMVSGKRRRAGAGVFHGEILARRIDRLALERPGNVRVISRNPQSITFSLNNAVFLKVFLRPEEGVNPDLELPQLLVRRGFFPCRACSPP
jgi:maltose alpha-D-glucosyltransferase/alpha-amylase